MQHSSTISFLTGNNDGAWKGPLDKFYISNRIGVNIVNYVNFGENAGLCIRICAILIEFRWRI